MAHFVYILYSPTLDRYYVGESEDPQRRLLEHLDHRDKGAATGKANDWQLRLVVTCNDRAHARKLERWIKSQKAEASWNGSSTRMNIVPTRYNAFNSKVQGSLPRYASGQVQPGEQN